MIFLMGKHMRLIRCLLISWSLVIAGCEGGGHGGLVSTETASTNSQLAVTPPQGLRAQRRADGIIINWAPVTQATGYELTLWRLDAGTPTANPPPDAIRETLQSTRFQHTSAMPNATYVYRVASIGGDGTRAESRLLVVRHATPFPGVQDDQGF